MNEIQPFYKFTAITDGDGDDPTAAELSIFDVIGDWEALGEISAKAFSRDLAALPKSVKRLDIHINSPGGSVSDAQAIYSRLADHKSQKVVYVDGLAASAASIVAMVGHKVYIRANANMMIHLPMGLTAGNKLDHAKSMRALQSVEDGMINAYAKKTGLTRDEIAQMLADETWFNADQAVAKGFADEVRGVIKTTAMIKGTHKAIFNGVEFDLSRFRNVPAFTATTEEHKQTMETKPAATAAAPEQPKPGEQPTKPAEETPKPPAGTPAPPAPVPPEKPAAAAATQSFDDGIKAERKRIADLQAYDRPATHDIVAKAITDGKTVAEVMPELFAAMEKGKQQTERRMDASVMSRIEGSDTTPAGDGNDEDFGVKLTKAVEARLKARGSTRAVVHGRN